MVQSHSVNQKPNVLTHIRFSAQPIVQTRKVGRYPKEVTSLRSHAREKRYAAYLAEKSQMEVDVLRNAIAAANRAIHSMSYELATHVQRNSTGAKSGANHG